MYSPVKVFLQLDKVSLECFDVAMSIRGCRLDGSDCLMLSQERKGYNKTRRTTRIVLGVNTNETRSINDQGTHPPNRSI